MALDAVTIPTHKDEDALGKNGHLQGSLRTRLLSWCEALSSSRWRQKWGCFTGPGLREM